MSKVSFPTPGHDHRACVDRSLTRARAIYASQGSRLTALRETVLQELAGSHKALGAYDIMRRIERKGRNVAPISVYRALDSLLAAGLIHRLESCNAYLACHVSHDGERPVLFLLCDKCGTVAESSAPDLAQALKSAAQKAKFALSQSVLEARGLCDHCAR